MTDSREPTSAGHSGGRGGPSLGTSLGPEQVGQRVVVRRVLPGETGPSGGPAMTDVLGVMETWADGETTIRRHDGTVVVIRTADIVSGKPVPPRRPRRGSGGAQP